MANFDRIKLIPFSLMELSVELCDKLGMYEVEKSVADVTVVLDKIIITL